MIKGD